MTDWVPGPALAAYHAGVTVVCHLAAHLRCVADDYHEYLDDAPLSRLARLMARRPSPESLARKLARQNAAELAALPDGPAPEHITAFAASARAYAARALAVWDLPHHRYGDTVVTVAGMVGAACAEWHLHAWDLAASLGKDYRPASPELLAAGWQAGMPYLPLDAVVPVGPGGATVAVAGDAGGPHPASPGAWEALLRASGRVPRYAYHRR